MIPTKAGVRTVTVRIIPEEPRTKDAPTTGEDPEDTTAVDPRPDRIPVRIRRP